MVYQFFFGELTAVQAKAGELAAQGKNVSGLRARHKGVTGLSDGNFEALRSLAAESVAAERAANREMTLLLKGVTSQDGLQRIVPELTRLRASAESSKRNAVEELRTRLEPEQFAELDRRIREYVVPNMKRQVGATASRSSLAGAVK